jgi:hypothetical protein
LKQHSRQQLTADAVEARLNDWSSGTGFAKCPRFLPFGGRGTGVAFHTEGGFDPFLPGSISGPVNWLRKQLIKAEPGIGTHSSEIPVVSVARRVPEYVLLASWNS